MRVRRNHDDFIKEMHSINENIIVLGTFKTVGEKLECKCKVCNYVWFATPENLIYRKSGCPNCAGNIKRTISEFNKKLHNIKPYITTSDNYLNQYTKMHFKCSKCNYEWFATPKSVLNSKSNGCPNCYDVNYTRKSQNEYISELNIKNPNLLPMQDYKGANKPVLHKCLKHNYEFKIAPSKALSGQGCKYCGLEKIGNKKRNTENYLNRLSSVQPNIALCGEYISCNKPVLHKCLICGHEWKPYPINLLKKEGCPKCNVSKGEARCLEVLNTYRDISVREQYSFKDLKSNKGWALKFDFAIFDKDGLLGLIEYDGDFHFRKIYHNQDYEGQITRDRQKDIYCKNNDIPLLRIPYMHFEDIPILIKNFLKEVI